MSVLSPWQPFSIQFLYICSVIYRIWETAPHLISNHKKDDTGLLLTRIPFSLASKTNDWHRSHNCVKLQSSSSWQHHWFYDNARLQGLFSGRLWSPEDFLDGMGKKQVIQAQNLGLHLRPCWISFSIFFILSSCSCLFIHLSFLPILCCSYFLFPLSCGSQEGGRLPDRRNIRSCPYLIQFGSPGAESFHGYDNFTVKTKMSVCLGILPKEQHKWWLMVRPWSPTLPPVPEQYSNNCTHDTHDS